jgi:hypothetical protein
MLMLAAAGGAELRAAFLVPGANVNVSRRAGNQHESTISIDPTNPQRLFAAANLETAGNFVAYSGDGGASWVGRTQGGGDGTPPGGGDVQSAWDRFGNLFLTYLSSACNHFLLPGSVITAKYTSSNENETSPGCSPRDTPGSSRSFQSGP